MQSGEKDFTFLRKKNMFYIFPLIQKLIKYDIIYFSKWIVD